MTNINIYNEKQPGPEDKILGRSWYVTVGENRIRTYSDISTRLILGRNEDKNVLRDLQAKKIPFILI